MPHGSTALRSTRLVLPGLLLALSLLSSGCAAAPGKNLSPAAHADQFNDPLENVNRAVFHFNDTVVYHYVMDPLATAYRKVLPSKLRTGLHNLFRNLRGPIIFANDVLQGRVADARDTFARFVINSTIGIGGLVDIAGHAGIPYHYQDFGVTFGVWGIGPGPYLVLPVLGPTDPRDLAGDVAEGFADPWNIVAANNGEHIVIYARGMANGIDTYARNMDQLKELKRTSIDYYAAMRSLYQQHRAALIEHGKELPTFPGLSENDRTQTVTVRPLPPPPALLAEEEPSARQSRPPLMAGAAAPSAELFPPHPARAQLTARNRHAGAQAELFPPPDLVADRTGESAPSAQ